LYICDNLKNMIEFTPNFPLKQYNTFGIDVKAKYFAGFSSLAELHELVDDKLFTKHPRLILGGGSNVLFTKDFDGLIIHPKLEEINIVEETNKEIILNVGSGIIWDNLVEYAVLHGWGGLENLSAIPGNVGAAPIQNIGAYGAEIKDVIDKVIGIDLSNKRTCTFKKTECEFGYRSSIFKTKLKSNFLITHVVFRLKKFPHSLITGYGEIERILEHEKERTISVIRTVICNIRSSKLPDVKTNGNAGSFFKNPVVDTETMGQLKKRMKDIPVYETPEGGYKLSAAWLIEKSGCKGIRSGNAGTHDHQPLVLINHGNATGKEILGLADFIKEKVYQLFGVALETEVNVI